MCRVSGPLWDLVVWQVMVYEGESWLVFHKCVFNLDLALFKKNIHIVLFFILKPGIDNGDHKTLTVKRKSQI